ncbi:MAG: PorT family protein [Flavobacteriaceae bacterium]|jgi:hypothetical protein|nr:PorT family protein [Flavobacteriaceae bacterium]
MRKTFLKAIIISAIGFQTFADAQLFRTKDRMDKLESFDNQKFSWGFYLGVNNFDYKLVLDPMYGMSGQKSLVTSKSSYSFGAGLIGKMRINNNFDLRIEPGLQFVERELLFNTQINDIYSGGTTSNLPFDPIFLGEKDMLRTVKATYLDVPLMLEFHGDRWYNSRPYVAAGVNWMMNLQSNADSSDDNLQGLFRSTSSNFAWSAEVGIQLYFNRFKLTPAIRGTFMINDEVVSDNFTTPPYWTPAISSMKTRAIMFVLKFE